MNKYCLGVIFSNDLSRVFLLRRDHPEWQAGRLNGFGGKLLPGELSRDSMRREAMEEAGYEGEWKRLGRMYGEPPSFNCVIFFSVMTKDTPAPAARESQAVEEIPVADLAAFESQMIPPLSLIIRAALDCLSRPGPDMMLETFFRP